MCPPEWARLSRALGWPLLIFSVKWVLRRMAYRVPGFNLLCNLYAPDVPGVPGVPTSAPRIAGQPCALVYGRRVNTASSGGTSSPGIPVQTIDLLLPFRTDVRGPQDTISFDMAEVPAGTGRWYAVTFVDDIGRGYPNEHRTATLFALAASWTAPYG